MGYHYLFEVMTRLEKGACCWMHLQDFGRGARIELSKMAKLLGMKFIGFNPNAQQVSLEFKGKGVTYPLEEFVRQYERECTTSLT
ncbi:hypothetical protein SAMN05443529_101277 [Desulfosporosinus hippei DSM 8344]|uniref:Uncharacterized protein n=2 Tax=Desulfosporosinus TaxID=79206 RepID=A0A1G7S3I4_9FIRM|nr:hypothetical protein SAMN05443529_101277 [Desulfosporosinus hippei DSM 8344]